MARRLRNGAGNQRHVYPGREEIRGTVALLAARVPTTWPEVESARPPGP